MNESSEVKRSARTISLCCLLHGWLFVWHNCNGKYDTICFWSCHKWDKHFRWCD